MEKIINELPEKAKEKWVENKKYFAKLKKRPPKRLDLIVQEIHDHEFESTDCLDCANCCKTTSPIFSDKDISRISKYLKMKEHQFISQYLERDKDDFMVLKSAHVLFWPRITRVLSMMLDPRRVANIPIQIEKILLK